MTNSLGRETIHIGDAPKHILIIGIKEPSGKVITDKDLIDLRGNQSNSLSGCLKMPIWFLGITGTLVILHYIFYKLLLLVLVSGDSLFFTAADTIVLLYGIIATGLFVLYLKKNKLKRANLELKIRNELNKV